MGNLFSSQFLVGMYIFQLRTKCPTQSFYEQAVIHMFLKAFVYYVSNTWYYR